MNIQTLKSKLLKGEIDGTKEVVAVIDNKEYSLIGLTKSPGKVLLVAELKEGIHVGESIEDEKVTLDINEGATSGDTVTPGLETAYEDEIVDVIIEKRSTTVAEDIEMDKRVESKKKRKK